MSHYVCSGGCNGVAPEPGVCTADTCPRHDKPLVECDCADNTHPGIMTACAHCGGLCKENGGCEVENFKEELPSAE